MYDVYEKNLNSRYVNEFIDRDSKITDVLGPNAFKNDIREFASCNHDMILENDYGKTFKELLDEISEIMK